MYDIMLSKLSANDDQAKKLQQLKDAHKVLFCIALNLMMAMLKQLYAHPRSISTVWLRYLYVIRGVSIQSRDA